MNDEDPEESGSIMKNPFKDNRTENTTLKSAHDLSSRKLNEYLFKAVRYRHMDLELARFIMIKSLVSPKQLYLHTKRSK
jgi:hypothetical protein